MWELNHKVSWALKKWYFWTAVLEKTLESPLDFRRSNQSILKEINPEYSLEGMMIKLKLQYFGHLMQRANLLEKTLMLGKIEGRRRRGWQRSRWLDGITYSMDMSLSKLQEMLMGREACASLQVCCSLWVRKVSDTTEQLNNNNFFCIFFLLGCVPYRFTFQYLKLIISFLQEQAYLSLVSAFRKPVQSEGHNLWPTGQTSLWTVQFSSVTQSCQTLCNPMNRSMPGLPVHHELPEFTQTHAHRVSDAIQTSHSLSSPSPPAPSPSQHQGLFQWVTSLHVVAKVLELQHQSFQ